MVLRFLRLALPLCLVAAALVAGQGLLRVVSKPTAAPIPADSPSLSLGSTTPTPAAGGGGVALTAPSALPPIAVPRTSATPKPSAAPAPTRPPAVHLTEPVTVLNASGVHGLAQQTAAGLRDRGVVVAAVGNVRPQQPLAARAVFYFPGASAQAADLATLASANTVAPAPSWLRNDGRLVLVISADNVSTHS